MKFYYKEKGYSCSWKNNLKGDYWSNMEHAKIKVCIPLTLYKEIVSDIRLQEEKPPTIIFKIHKEKDEVVNWGSQSSDESELWNFTAIIERISYSSKFKDDMVMSHIDCLIQYNNKCDKSELRDTLLNELV